VSREPGSPYTGTGTDTDDSDGLDLDVDLLEFDAETERIAP
jgi:hypothetical protein